MTTYNLSYQSPASGPGASVGNVALNGDSTVDINNVAGYNILSGFSDAGVLDAAVVISGAGALSIGVSTPQTEGATTVSVGGFGPYHSIGQSVDGTITDAGVTLYLGVTNAATIDASAAPKLLMLGPDDYSPAFPISGTPSTTGITVLGGAESNLLQGSLSAVTAVAGVGVTGAALNDAITGGATGGDVILGDGGADTITLPAMHKLSDTVVFGADAVSLFSEHVLAVTNGSDQAYQGYWGVTGSSPKPIDALPFVNLSGDGGTSADMTTIAGFHAGSSGDVLQFDLAAWAGGTPGPGRAGNLEVGQLSGLDAGSILALGNASLTPIWTNASSNSSLGDTNLDNVLLYEPGGKSLANAAALVDALTSTSGAVALPSLTIAPGQHTHILVAYESDYTISILHKAVTISAVTIADVDLVNTSAVIAQSTNTAGLDVIASDMVQLTGVTLSSLTSHNIQFA